MAGLGAFLDGGDNINKYQRINNSSHRPSLVVHSKGLHSHIMSGKKQLHGK